MSDQQSSFDKQELRQQLDELGFVLLPNVLTPNEVADLRQQIEELFAREGELAGSEFRQEPNARRLANMANKGEAFRALLLHPLIFPLIQHVLGSDAKLSSQNVREAPPHANCRQPLHCDMGALPDERGPWVANTVWLLNDFTAENGALRVVPRSHRSGKLPHQDLADPLDPHRDEQLVLATAGSVIVMDAHLWHGATDNRTDGARMALHNFYCRRDKPQQQYQKQLLDPGLQEQLSPELRKLLALDDAENDRLCTAEVERSGFLTTPRRYEA